MSAGAPSAEWGYENLPYQFPQWEGQGVVRIRVHGPKPYNTLVVVRATLPLTRLGWADGKLRTYRFVIPTAFVLAGFDQRVEPVVQHSGTAVIQMIQTSAEASFFEGVDAVEGSFDEAGRWLLTCDVASAWDDGFSAARGYVSSWVLCHEPPLEKSELPDAWRPRFSFDPSGATQFGSAAGLQSTSSRQRVGLARGRRGREALGESSRNSGGGV
jgi:hypothetical protein